MGIKLSDQVREMAKKRYVGPAIQSGKVQFSIRVRDLLGDLQAVGFPAGHTPQICSALQTAKFLRENGLEIESIEGPPSKMSPTVVFRYHVAKNIVQPEFAEAPATGAAKTAPETPEDRAYRLAAKLRGLLKEELAQYGGGEAFIRWVRGYDEENAA
ncbi:MAG TPA: hypothetical protein VHX20_04560 [Terracidiphilus sp.]|jgi:hypothetical protein|nr:hypothetical protein [Terracidiphilus sp.]